MKWIFGIVVVGMIPFTVETCLKWDAQDRARREIEREKWEAKITEMNMKGYYRECGWSNCQWRKDK